MKNNWQYLFWDLDGTLTDPGLGITNSVAHALAKHNIQVADRSELYRFIGPPLVDSFMKYYGYTHEEAVQGVEDYREYFRDKGLFENQVYEGIPELLQRLKNEGKVLIVATSKPEDFSVRILEYFGLLPYFDVVAGATMDQSRTKKADVIRYAIGKVGLTDLSRAVMIGDRLHDVEGAHEAGLPCIGVLYGYGDRPELEAAGADAIAETMTELGDLL